MKNKNTLIIFLFALVVMIIASATCKAQDSIKHSTPGFFQPSTQDF